MFSAIIASQNQSCNKWPKYYKANKTQTKFLPISSIFRKSPCCPVRLFGRTLLVIAVGISHLDSCEEGIEISGELAISPVSPKTSVKPALKKS